MMREQPHAKDDANKVLMLADNIYRICTTDACEEFLRKRGTGLPSYASIMTKLQMLSRFDKIYLGYGYAHHEFCNRFKAYRQLEGSIAGKEVTTAEELPARAKSQKKLF